MALRCARRTTALLFLTIVLLELILISHHIMPSEAIKKNTLKMLKELLPIIALLKYLQPSAPQTTSQPSTGDKPTNTNTSTGHTSVIMPIIIFPGRDYGSMDYSSMQYGSKKGVGDSMALLDMSSMGGFGGGSMSGFGSINSDYGGGCTGGGGDLSSLNEGYGSRLMKPDLSSQKRGRNGMREGNRSGTSAGRGGGHVRRMRC